MDEIRRMSLILLGILWALLAPPAASAFEFTPPPGEPVRPLGEWEGQRRLVMVFHADLPPSEEGVRGLQAIRDAYLHVIKSALPRANVTVILPSSADALDFVSWVHEKGLGEHLRDGRLLLESFPVDTLWIRDYNVLLARGEESRALYAVDPLYVQNAPGSPRYHDDRMAYWLFRDTPVRWLRPPLRLDGGNFETDGRGLCFTSKQTLGANEASRGEVEEALRRYLGCRETVFLEPIPIESTGHLDIFFKVLSPDLWVLGSYSPRAKPEGPTDHLERLAHAAMEKNAATLRAVLGRRGGGRLLRMPMPRPHTFEHYLWDPKEWALGERKGRPASRLGSDKRFKTQVGYATYVNSLYVRGARGELVIVPSYAAGEHDGEAVALYREAYPRAEVIRMPSDYLVQDEGAAHCVIYAMPE